MAFMRKFTILNLNYNYKKSLIDLGYMPNNKSIDPFNLDISLLNYEKDKAGKNIIHFIQMSKNEFLYSKKNLFKKDIRDAQMLVLGEKKAKEIETIALERLEKLFNKVPELRNITYRTLLRIISENSDIIKCYVDENIGYKSQRNFYIHKDNWENRKTTV